MGSRRDASRRWLCRIVPGLAGACAFLVAPCLGWSAAQTGAAEELPGFVPAPSAEITYTTPRRFAAVIEPSTRRQRLYGVGDVLPGSKGLGGEYQVEEISEGRLRVGDLRGRKAIRISVGDAVPGKPGWRVAGTPVRRTVEYRYVATGGPLDAEPRVVELWGDRASLEVDITPVVSGALPHQTQTRTTSVPPRQRPEASRGFENTLLGRVRVKPTSEDSYEIDAGDLNAALESRLQLLSETWPKVWPTAASRPGGGLQVQSPVADGTLGLRGFRVTSPNLAERGGVEVGDVILGVNGQAVNTFSDVYRVYRQMQSDPHLTVIQLDLERQGRHVTKTYRIR